MDADIRALIDALEKSCESFVRYKVALETLPADFTTEGLIGQVNRAESKLQAARITLMSVVNKATKGGA